MGRGPAKAKKETTSSKRGAASAAAAGKQTRKPRKKKDPNAPKRALTPFMFFGKECREILKVEMPKLGFLEVSSEIGRRWAQIDEQGKKKYEKLSQSDKDRYLDEKEQYIPDPEYENSGKGKGARGKTKDPNAPKRPLSAYFFFCQEIRPAIREKNPTKSITEIAPLLSEQWRAVPEKKRAKYHTLAAEAKAKYQVALATYKNGGVAVDDDEGAEDGDEDEVEDEEVDEEVHDDDDEEGDDDEE
ncbi:hypothetical protein H257_06278 [Aphanomyces astaci]|uniref:HMG box domain-containing protein n=1 Tax=Aphanomyces astaci TaxID=112090 RepID=W4GM76_APHAT|nr:hypothetical protein H257_06278 [Aphanomyces astaci]ETV80810.1 hypothetical protein H257_06278 [Aphanomyces astaci]RQM20997.1 hypothetical protein B5M09_000198 [Aphanomyces astaci]|eukprot:XP_009829757.1 hypothetical protein H257_06278 [Aphanomyces astaci]